MRTKTQPKVKCGKCGVFVANLKVHMDVCAPNVMICKLCDRIFTNAYDLNEHAETCSKEKSTCNICGITCTQMSKHKLRHDPSNAKHMCGTCGRKFYQQYDLKVHERRHADKVACDACGKMVSNLKSHTRLCTKALANQALIRCKKCGKVFASLESKLAHVCKTDVHTCEICGVGYTQFVSLKLHKLERHLGTAGTFICDTCGKQFQTKFKLSEHEQTHKPKVLCKICGKMVYETKRHKQACQNPKLRKCDYCDRTIKGSLSHLQRHIARHHGHANVGKKGEYYCKKCGEKYMYKGWVEAHERECQGFGLVLQSSTEPEICEHIATPTDTDGQTVSEQVEVAMVLPSDLDTQSGDTMLTDLSTNTVYIIKQ